MAEPLGQPYVDLLELLDPLGPIDPSQVEDDIGDCKVTAKLGLAAWQIELQDLDIPPPPQR